MIMCYIPSPPYVLSQHFVQPALTCITNELKRTTVKAVFKWLIFPVLNCLFKKLFWDLTVSFVGIILESTPK